MANEKNRWASDNKPVGYVLGVTPGFSQYETGDLRLAYMGLARKITKAARLGFEFAQIDFEELSEAKEPEIVEQVKMIKETQNIEIGVHLPITIDLCIAYAFEWRYFHDQLRMCAKASGEAGSKYILFHSSSHARPNITSAFLGRREAPGKLVGPDGTNLGTWIIQHDMKEWFMTKFIRIMFSAMGVAGDPAVIDYFENMESFKPAKEYAEKIYKKGAALIEEEIMRLRARIEDIERVARTRKLTVEEIREYEILLTEYKEKNTKDYLIRKTAETNRISEKEAARCLTVARYTIEYDFDSIFDFWLRQGSEGEEYVAYLTVAEYMFKHNDRIWTSVAKLNQSPYHLSRESSRKLGILSEKEIDKLKRIVTAVAAKYIEGHLFTRTEQYGIKVIKEGKAKYQSVYEYCRDKNMRIYIETSMPEKGAEGELRIMSVIDHINICKAIDGGRLINYCIDFEHLLTNLIDPIEEAKRLLSEQPGDGRYITCLHTNAPRPMMGAHAPIEIMSQDLLILYKWIYILRQAGVKNTYMIWEMGSYGVRQSAIAFRNIIKELTRETPPEKLPKEFYGIAEDYEARQRVAIREHAFDPLKGLLVIPEEDWTMLGRRATERGKAREWERERYR